MIELDAGNVLLKPSQRRQMMGRLRRCLKLGSRLGGFLLRITIWRTGRQYELRAAVRDRSGAFGCRVLRADWAEAVHDLVQALSRRLHDHCLRRRAA